MGLNVDNVTRGVTGVVSVGDITATAPTSASSVLTGFEDLGWVSEDGVTRTMPGTGDREVIRGWQNNGVVLVIRTANDDNPTFQFVLLESKLEVVEYVLGVTVTQSATDGKWVIDTDAPRDHHRLVLDVIHGARIRRQFVPKGIVTEIGDQVYAFGEPIGWEVTVEAERDEAIGGHVVEWDTALKTPTP